MGGGIKMVFLGLSDTNNQSYRNGDLVGYLNDITSQKKDEVDGLLSIKEIMNKIDEIALDKSMESGNVEFNRSGRRR